MNLQKMLKLGLLALAIMLVASAVPANAQQVYKATFTLPFEAQWGSTVIEPGEYTISVEDAPGQQLVRLRGSADLAVFPGLTNWEPYGEKAKLVFVNINGLYTLRSFEASEIGKSFTFPIHKSKGERAQLTTVSVAAN
ncbi:MAG TPA: hypothetical protein VKT81_13650 [Bryobacteraceae bacterium]|nr:hypothetical protein [Bryobacteraceae bacterium]